MKKLLIVASCLLAVLVLSNVSFAQTDSAQKTAPLTVEKIADESDVAGTATSQPSQPQVLPFGYPPYPMVGQYPAYGVPYSFPRHARRSARFAAQLPYQPLPLPQPGIVSGIVPPQPQPYVPQQQLTYVPQQVYVSQPQVLGNVPPLQGTVGVSPAAPVGVPGQPTVFYRPTPVKNFFSLICAPRPYLGYDPYAAYPPYQGYQPQ